MSFRKLELAKPAAAHLRLEPRHECPRCTSVHFKPAEERSFDGLLSMLALRPVRCTFCWRRYYWFAFHPPNSA